MSKEDEFGAARARFDVMLERLAGGDGHTAQNWRDAAAMARDIGKRICEKGDALIAEGDELRREMTDTYEYEEILVYNSDDMVAVLNERGADGWEVVSIEQSIDVAARDVLLKRRKMRPQA